MGGSFDPYPDSHSVRRSHPTSLLRPTCFHPARVARVEERRDDGERKPRRGLGRELGK